jgi:DNA-directed RNA polymerase alpha subunit
MEKNDNPRLVEDVLNKILEVIPISETKLLEDLKIFKKSLWYHAPELRRASECWVPFIQVLNKNIPNIEEEWQINIREILEN